MADKHRDHLSEADVFRMLVDPSDLSEIHKAHLAACPDCRLALDRLHGDLQQIGKISRVSAPQSAGAFRLPSREPGFASGPRLKRRSMPRLAFAALALALIVATALVIDPGRESRMGIEPRQPVDPDRLLAEIDELVEIPFAPVFFATASANEIDTGEDFMQYVVPAIENEPTSRKTKSKGESPC